MPLSGEAVNLHAYLLPKTAVNTPGADGCNMLPTMVDCSLGVLDPFTILCLIGALWVQGVRHHCVTESN
jgi:hypothetical protein